jgi:hypothetical protein
MNFARIINDVAVDVSADPESSFHPTIAAEFTQVPDAVQPGWKLVNGTWAAPSDQSAPEPPAPTPPKVSPVEFMLLFTSPERIAIKAERAADPVIDDWLDIIDDPRLEHVDLGLKSTHDALDYLTAKSLIGSGRKEQIIANTAQ